jgi:putative glycosyltransferase (TIGR04348 family)
VNILIVTPVPPALHTGNRTTAERWSLILTELGHQVRIGRDWPGSGNEKDSDLLIALHARRSFPAIDRFRQAHPGAPVVVALTGTDLYHDIESSVEARQSLEIADRLVVLQPCGVDSLPVPLHRKSHVIFQSAESAPAPDLPAANVFQVCVLAHLRPVKDPLRAAYAARGLPAGSRVQVAHAGGALDPQLAGEAESEQRRNPRYRWLGDLSREQALRLLAGSHLLALTSLLEGGANVVSEAIAASVPVVSTDIPGSVGILGSDYPGYFPTGDTQALRRLLERAETDPVFYADLKRRIRDLKPLVDPQRERESWRALLAGLQESHNLSASRG